MPEIRGEEMVDPIYIVLVLKYPGELLDYLLITFDVTHKKNYRLRYYLPEWRFHAETMMISKVLLMGFMPKEDGFLNKHHFGNNFFIFIERIA